MIDVGCGGGILAESMAARGAKVTGIDLAEKSLKVAMLHRLESGVDVDYRLVSAEDAAQAEPGDYDVVTCMEMLEHVPDPGEHRARLREARERPAAGWSSRPSTAIAKSFLFAIVGAEYVLRLLPRGTHEYAKFITPSELARALPRRGPRGRRHHGLDLQPAHRRVRARARRRRELLPRGAAR